MESGKINRQIFSTGGAAWRLAITMLVKNNPSAGVVRIQELDLATGLFHATIPFKASTYQVHVFQCSMTGCVDEGD